MELIKTELIDKKEIAKDTLEITIKKPAGYEFKSGQHASLNIKPNSDPTSDTKHTFSIASNPLADHIKFITRIRNSNYKNSLESLTNSDPIAITPAGGLQFDRYVEDGSSILYLTGGIGISPLLSYLDDTKRKDSAITLIWSNRSLDTTPYIESLNVKVLSKPSIEKSIRFYTRSKESGDFINSRINKESLTKVIDINEFENAFIIGNPEFVETMVSLLVSIGFPFDKIVTENFSGY